MAIPGMGTRVFDVSASINWVKARLWIFKILELKGHDFRNAPPTEIRQVIEDQMKAHRFSAHVLHIPRKFSSIDEGWDFVTKNDCEGLVVKNDVGPQLKLKFLKEAKWEIVGFEPGAVKGSFLLKNPHNGNVSGMSALSVGFIADYNKVLAAGNTPFAEFEYMYLTKKSGAPFQPRLRRIGTLADLSVS
jgi:ATP-dependent DNA ligase